MAQNEKLPFPYVRGIGRMFDNEKAILLILDCKPTDDELRFMHDYLNQSYKEKIHGRE